MNRNYLETLVGFAVIVIALIFVVYALKGADREELDGYTVNVSFERIDGLNLGGDVRISGIKVGTIDDAEIDPQTYRAKVKLSIKDEIKLPEDTSAEIISAGLLGDKYVALVPGGSDQMIKDGGRIKFSQPSVSLEALIGKFMFGSSEDKNGDQNETPAGTQHVN